MCLSVGPGWGGGTPGCELLEEEVSGLWGRGMWSPDPRGAWHRALLDCDDTVPPSPLTVPRRVGGPGPRSSFLALWEYPSYLALCPPTWHLQG